METTLRTVGRGVGHTHGWFEVLDKAEEESKRREEGGGEREFFFISSFLKQIWKSSSRLISQLFSFEQFFPFLFYCLCCFIPRSLTRPRSPAANHTRALYTPCMLERGGTRVTAYWKKG